MSYLPLRLQPGMDLRRSLEAVAGVKDETSAFVVSGIGSLSNARLRFAGAESETSLAGMFEIVCLSGTLAQDGAHLHMAIADEHGHVVGGHVCYGNIVRTTVEVLLAPLTERIRAAPRMEARTPDLVAVLDDIFRKLPITRAPGT